MRWWRRRCGSGSGVARGVGIGVTCTPRIRDCDTMRLLLPVQTYLLATSTKGTCTPRIRDCDTMRLVVLPVQKYLLATSTKRYTCRPAAAAAAAEAEALVRWCASATASSGITPHAANVQRSTLSAKCVSICTFVLVNALVFSTLVLVNPPYLGVGVPEPPACACTQFSLVIG